MPLLLQQDGMENSMTAVGMHKDAAAGKDRFDAIAMPYFGEALQLTSEHPEFFAPYFARDVVPAQNSYTWNFTLEASRSGPVELQWNRDAIKDSKAQLLLYDQTGATVLDMRTANSYRITTTASRTLQFIYSRDEYQVLNSEFGKPYPNPFKTSVTLPGFFNSAGENVMATILIRNLTGMEVFRKEIRSQQKGLLQPVWNGTSSGGEELPSGLYLYNIQYSDGKRILSSQGKLIKQ